MAKYRVTIEKIKCFEAIIEVEAINSYEAIKEALASNLDFGYINETLGECSTRKVGE